MYLIFIFRMCTTDPLTLDKINLIRLIQEKHKSISYGKPKETTKMSKCWNHFNQIYVDNVKQDFIICYGCKSILVYKSVTGSGCMLSHVQSCQAKEQNSDLSNHQQKINHYYSSSSNQKKPVPKRVKDAITSTCVDFVIQDSRPFLLLEGNGFISLAKQLFNTSQHLSSANVQIEDLLPSSTTMSSL